MSLPRITVGRVSLMILILFVALAVLAPVLPVHDPLTMAPAVRLEGPSLSHLMGTDGYGRDLLSRVIYGARSSLIVAVLSMAGATIVAVIIGLIAGYLGGFADSLIMRILDVIMAFPSIILGIALVAVLSAGLLNIVIVIGVISVPVLARIVRADALAVKNKEFVEASRVLGAPFSRVLWTCIFPNTVPSLVAMVSVGMAQAVILEAAFGFLGLGVQPPTPSWGNILSDGQQYLEVAPHVCLFPGICIALLAFALNAIGDSIRDYLDPQQRSRRRDSSRALLEEPATSEQHAVSGRQPAQVTSGHNGATD